MKKLLSKILIGSAVLGGGLAAPLIPQDMTLVMSYQDKPSQHRDSSYTTATSTHADPFMQFKDDDHNDLISIAVFADSKGKLVYQQIPDSEYASMGKKDGYKNNPKKTELVSILGAQKAKAAIAFDNATGANTIGSAATSLTYSKTNTGANLMLIVFVENANQADDITGITYNGVSLTQVRKRLTAVGNFPQYAYALQAPATSANNIVISWTTSKQARSVALSYTGVNQSVTLDSTGDNQAPGGSSPLTTTATTVADNSWLVTAAGIQRTPTASTGITFRTSAGSETAYKGADSNSAITPAGNYNFDWTFATAGGPEIGVMYVTLAPAAAVVASTPQDLIIINDE